MLINKCIVWLDKHVVTVNFSSLSATHENRQNGNVISPANWIVDTGVLWHRTSEGKFVLVTWSRYHMEKGWTVDLDIKINYFAQNFTKVRELSTYN